MTVWLTPTQESCVDDGREEALYLRFHGRDELPTAGFVQGLEGRSTNATRRSNRSRDLRFLSLYQARS